MKKQLKANIDDKWVVIGEIDTNSAIDIKDLEFLNTKIIVVKVLLEIEDAQSIGFDKDKRYPLLRNFKNDECIGYAEISKYRRRLYAELYTTHDVSELYPAVGYKLIKSNKEGKLIEGQLFAVGLSSVENEDNRILKVKDNLL